MKYIEAINNYEKQPGEVSIFLAGGIIGCGDWQREMTDRLSDTDLVVLNPRRASFPEETNTTTIQIKWEFDHLRKADMILFWFPREGQCMTSLFELGTWSRDTKTLFVGIEPGYVKEGGMRKQLALVRPSTPVVSSLDDLELLIKGTI